jgi:hypothetical protein
MDPLENLDVITTQGLLAALLLPMPALVARHQGAAAAAVDMLQYPLTSTGSCQFHPRASL